MQNLSFNIIFTIDANLIQETYSYYLLVILSSNFCGYDFTYKNTKLFLQVNIIT